MLKKITKVEEKIRRRLNGFARPFSMHELTLLEDAVNLGLDRGFLKYDEYKKLKAKIACKIFSPYTDGVVSFVKKHKDKIKNGHGKRFL